MSVDLSRFLDAHNKYYTEAYGQIVEKQYNAGWIDFVFPRLNEQCDSQRSKPFGLTEKEAKCFWKNKRLRNDYLHMLYNIEKIENQEFRNVLSERAIYKMKQSMELFIRISEELGMEEETNALKNFIAVHYNIF